jgi:Arc/MetJ-type ribon-helix-helix transcriptional regulator
MRLDEELVKAIDQAIKRLGTTRSAFVRDAVRRALMKERIAELERRYREGYARKPVKRGEFSVWETEQVWCDEEGRRSIVVCVFLAVFAPSR